MALLCKGWAVCCKVTPSALLYMRRKPDSRPVYASRNCYFVKTWVIEMPWTKHISTYTEEIRAHSGSVEYWSCFLWETCSVGSKTFLVARKITVKNSGVFLQSECQTKNFQGESQIDHTRLFYIHSLRYTMAFQSFWNSPCKINFPFPENSVVCLSTFDSRCPIVPSDI